MHRFDIGVDLDVEGAIIQQVYPRLREAVGAVAEQAYTDWADSVQKASLWSVERERYLRSLKWQYTGSLSAEVVSDYDKAADIETGRPSRDMKEMLRTSDKVRMSSKGYRYLIIPFRHNSPGSNATGSAMPAAVYAKARHLAASSVTGMGSRASGHGAWDIKTRAPTQTPQRHYAWGERLKLEEADHKKLGQRASRYEGMVRFDTSTGKAARSSYMTFRVMSERSTGWIVPAKPGLYLARNVSERLQPLAEKVFSEAVRLDMGL